MLRVDVRNIRYINGEVILNNARLNAEKGSVICISGSNGTGKSTFLQCLCGIIPNIIQAQGSIEVLIEGREDYENEVSYVSQYTENSLFYFDVQSQLMHMGRENMRNVLEYFLLEDKMQKKIQTLSSGQKKIVSILGALYTEKKVCILDEPTTFLDDETISKLFDVIRGISKNKIIILVSHDYKCQEFADLNYEIRNKELIKIEKKDFFMPTISPNTKQNNNIWESENRIVYTYPGAAEVIINQRIEFCQNEILGIIGKNGTGKTTIMNYYYQKYHKNGSVRGMLQDFRKQFFAFTVQSEVELLLGKKNIEKTNRYLERLRLYEFRQENPNFLSDGQKRLLLIGLLMLNKADVLFLDEAFDNLDTANRLIAVELIQEFRSNYRTIVLMDQNLEDIYDVVDRVIEL